MRWLPVLIALMLPPLAARVAAEGRSPYKTVIYQDELGLKGMLYLPAGKGPFPVMIYNHDSGNQFRRYPWLVEPFNGKGWALFIPWRCGAGLSKDASRGPGQPRNKGRQKVAFLESQALDVLDAVEWVKKQPWADTKRMAMMGNSYGGIMTVLAAESDTGVGAFIPTAPGALSWDDSAEIRERLIAAVRRAHGPMFFIQAENDKTIENTKVLYAELKAAGKGGLRKIYPATTSEPPPAGHGFGCQKPEIWGPDVFAFLDASLPAKR